MIKRNPDIAFTRNPVCFSDGGLPGPTRRFDVSVGDCPAYTGRYTPPASIDVAEIAEAYVAPIPPPEGTPVDDAGVMLRIEDETQFEARLVAVTGEDGEPLMPEFFALPGGISPQNFRRLKELDTDIFAARLLDKRRNFFLTTRTHGWMILLDELEVYPLAFVSLHDEDSEIAVKAAGTEFSVTAGSVMRGIYAIDIRAARMKIAADYGFLASVFDVIYDGYTACRVVIRETPPERDTTLVRFRNSMGVFELLHLSGGREAGAAPEEAGEDLRRYDGVTGRYFGISRRQSMTRTLTVSTGFRTDDEIRFVLDMAASEEVYLRDRTGWVSAVPSVETLQLASPQIKPESVKVKLTVSDVYDSLTPDIDDLKDFVRPRIFSDQHTDQFN